MRTKRLFKSIMPIMMAVALFITALPVSGVKAKAASDFTPDVSVKEKKITLQINHPVEGKKMGDVGIVKYTHYLDTKNTITFQESWNEVGASLYFGNNDTFIGGHRYHYEALIYASKEDLSSFSIDREYREDCIHWATSSVHTTHKDAHTIVFEGDVEASFKPPYNMGEYTLDLSKGNVKMDYLSGDIIYYTLYALNMKDKRISGENEFVEGSDELVQGYDLDQDGSCDMNYYWDASGNYIYGPSIDNSIDGQITFFLSNDAKKNYDKYRTRYYSALTIKLPETSGKSRFNQGSPTIDLSKGPYFTSNVKNIGYFYAFYKACIYEGSIKENEKSPTEADIDLDKDGTWDININLTLTASLDFVDMTITALPTSSIKTKITKSLSESIKKTLDMGKRSYYGEATFVFPGSESAASSDAKKVEDPAPAHNVGETVANGGASFKISSVEEGKETVTYAKPDSNKATNATIPDAITIDNKEYKVTEIAPGAFKGNKKLKKVTIGKNIVKIGAKAFFRCKNLKTVNVKTTSLTKSSVGGSAFKGIHEKAKVKVPKKKLKDYQKIFKARGVNGKSQKITK